MAEEIKLVEEAARTDEVEARLKALEDAERAIESAYSTGRAERAAITQAAQLDAAEAVAMAGIAMEADVEADEAMRLAVIAEKSGDRKRAKAARANAREARKKARDEHKAATESAKRAYDAIKFSAPNKMGFMRVVQVLFACHIAIYLVWLMLTSRDHMTYDVTSMMDWVMVILEGVAFWMFINRYKIARPLVMGMSAIGLVVPAAVDVSLGTFNPFALSTGGAFYLFLFLYFAFSKRVKATLVNDLGKDEGDYDKDDFVVNRHGWPFVRNLIIYFILFSVIGHWMEMGMCQFIILGVVQGEYDPTNTMLWRDWLYPFPMEGAAVVIIALVLYPFWLWLREKFPGKKRVFAYIISFVAGALLCSVIEFSMGLIVNSDLQLWDYSDNFGNIMGQVCLQNTLAFGAVASIITWWVYPLLERWIARVPRDIMNIVAVVVFVFGGIIWSLYLVDPPTAGTQGDVSGQASAAAQQRADARDNLGTAVEGVGVVNSALHELVAGSDALSAEEKESILAGIDGITKNIQAIQGELAEDEAMGSSAAAPAGSQSAASEGSPAAEPADSPSAEAAGSQSAASAG